MTTKYVRHYMSTVATIMSYNDVKEVLSKPISIYDEFGVVYANDIEIVINEGELKYIKLYRNDAIPSGAITWNHLIALIELYVIDTHNGVEIVFDSISGFSHLVPMFNPENVESGVIPLNFACILDSYVNSNFPLASILQPLDKFTYYDAEYRDMLANKELAINTNDIMRITLFDSGLFSLINKLHSEFINPLINDIYSGMMQRISQMEDICIKWGIEPYKYL